MHDVIEQLRKYSEAVADRVPAVSADSVTDRPSRRRYQRMLTAAAVVVVLALVVGVVVTRDGGTRRRPASSVPKPSKVTTIEPRNNTEGIDLIEPPPLGPRGDIATAFTGTELVAWGGDLEASNMGLPGPDRTYADGAAYNLATRRWRPMSTGPLPTTTSTRVAAATAAGVVVASDRAVARWNPASDTWTAFDQAPTAVRDLTTAGVDLVLSFSAQASLNPSTGRWSTWPTPPVALQDTTTAWTGTELIAVGRGSESLAALAFNPATRRWIQLPAPTGLDANAFRIAWDGSRVIGVDYAMASATYTPGATAWIAGSEVPARFFEHWPQLAAADPGVVTTMARALIVGDADRWVPVPLPEQIGAGVLVPLTTEPGTRAAQIAMIGNRHDGTLAVVIVDPVRLAANVRLLQVGMVGVPVVDNARIAKVTGEGGSSPQRTVTAELQTRSGTCTVTSGYQGFSRRDLPPRWIRDSADGTRWHADVTTTDRVTVDCTTAEDARKLTDQIKLPDETPSP